MLIREWSPTRIKNGLSKRVARTVLPALLPAPGKDLALTLIGSAEDARMLPLDLLGSDALCYCIGVGDSITLDLDLVARGHRVHAFDPTPESIEFMDRLDYDAARLTFHPLGVWSENTELKFFAPAVEERVNWSVLDLHETGEYFTAQCRTLRTIMNENGHDHIDLLKLDVEGAWEPILTSMIEEGIRPRVLAVEFDSPTSIGKVRRMTAKLAKAGLVLAHISGEDYLFVASDEL